MVNLMNFVVLTLALKCGEVDIPILIHFDFFLLIIVVSL